MYDYNSKVSTCQYRVLIDMSFIIIYILIDNYTKKLRDLYLLEFSY